MFWQYYQSVPGYNNLIDNENLTTHVIIEADDPLEANKITEEKGMKFHIRECPCCDPRWEDLLKTDIDLGTEIPCIYDQPVDNCEDSYYLNDSVIIHYKDGRKEKTRVRMKGDK